MSESGTPKNPDDFERMTKLSKQVLVLSTQFCPPALKNEDILNKQRLPIDQFSVDYEVPLDLASRLVGRTEAETKSNMGMFIDYLRSLMSKYHDPKIEWERK